MALIYCTNCGKQVSSLAEKCPHCGSPVNIATIPVSEDSTTTIHVNKKKWPVWKWIVAVAGGIICLIGLFFTVVVVVALVGGYDENGNNTINGSQQNVERTQNEQPRENLWEEVQNNKFIGRYKIGYEHGEHGNETVFEVLPDGRVVEYPGNSTKHFLGSMVVLNNNAFLIGGESVLGEEFYGVRYGLLYKEVNGIAEQCGQYPTLTTCTVFDLSDNRGYIGNTYPEALSAYDNRDVSTAYFIKFKKI